MPSSTESDAANNIVFDDVRVLVVRVKYGSWIMSLNYVFILPLLFLIDTCDTRGDF